MATVWIFNCIFLLCPSSLSSANSSGPDIFQFLTVDGEKDSMYQHIRENTNYNSPVTGQCYPFFSFFFFFCFSLLCLYPLLKVWTNIVIELDSTDLRCNVGGDSGADTETASITAGSEFTFTADIAVYHQGPVSL